MGVREPSLVCPGMMFSLFGKRARDPHGQRLFEARFGGRGLGMGIVCGSAGAHRGVLSFGHFFGREGLLDESLWSRDPHLLEKRGDDTCEIHVSSEVIKIHAGYMRNTCGIHRG